MKKILLVSGCSNTEKDFYRIKKFGLKKINFIPTDFKIEDEKRFVKILKRYI